MTLPAASIVCASNPASLASMANSQSQPATAQILIARLYDNANYDTSAGYLNVYSTTDCTASTGNIDYSIGDLGSWANRVSSFQSYGNCATPLWSGTNFTGTAYPSGSYLVDSSYVGAAFNDKAKSAQFS